MHANSQTHKPYIYQSKIHTKHPFFAPTVYNTESRRREQAKKGGEDLGNERYIFRNSEANISNRIMATQWLFDVNLKWCLYKLVVTPTVKKEV